MKNVNFWLQRKERNARTREAIKKSGSQIQKFHPIRDKVSKDEYKEPNKLTKTPKWKKKIEN